MAKVERTNLFCRKPTPEVKDDYCGLELYLSPEKGEETQITSDLISEEVKKYGELENIKIYDRKEGEPVKVFISFSNHFTTNLVRQKLDRSNLGKTRINIRAIFSQANSMEEREEQMKSEYDLRHIRACSCD